jgi:hypothetical protein
MTFTQYDAFAAAIGAPDARWLGAVTKPGAAQRLHAAGGSDPRSFFFFFCKFVGSVSP